MFFFFFLSYVGTRGNGLTHLKNGVDYINPGEEDQMEIYGWVDFFLSMLSYYVVYHLFHWKSDTKIFLSSYKRNQTLTALTWFMIVISGGVLRLIFHWVPHLMLITTHVKCPLEEADTVLLVERFQGKHKSYHVKRLKVLTAKEISWVILVLRIQLNKKKTLNNKFQNLFCAGKIHVKRIR